MGRDRCPSAGPKAQPKDRDMLVIGPTGPTERMPNMRLRSKEESKVVDEDGVITLTPEEEALLLKIRAEKAAEKGKTKVDQIDKEAKARAKKREADALRLKALQLQREEIELQERALREAMRAEETGGAHKDRRERRAYDEEDESDSDSHPRRKRAKQPYSSDSDEEPDGTRLRLNRLEKVMFGDRRPDREPIVTQEIELYRPPPGEERQFPKMSEFNGKGDPEDHCEKVSSMWYKSLKPRSIGSYEKLKRKFLKYYSHLCRKAKDTEALVYYRQRANEELGDYLARFKEEAGMVTNLDKIKAMGFLTAGLDPYKGKKLRSSLYDFPPKSLNDIYVRGENIRRKMESIGGYKDSRRDDRSKRADRYEGSRSGPDRRDSRKEGRKETDRGAERRRDRDPAVFTPLNALISKILHEIKGKP
ncbi:hypothetical protein AgCh_019733 [Apium graveolens]